MTTSPVCGTGGREFPRRRFPCNECPIRADNRDNPTAKFPAARWAALTASVVDPATGFGPDFDAPLFGCHKGTPGQASEDLACAGWLARFGGEHPRVRLAHLLGWLPDSALVPGENWPPLHAGWVEVVAAQTSDHRDGGDTPACPAAMKPSDGNAFAVGPSDKEGRR